MSVALKANVVHQDETEEKGTRMLLNLGHTVAHGLEAATDYRGFRHGEAVALGMIAAMRVAQQVQGTRQEETERLTRLLARLGLPTDLDAQLNPRVLGFIGSDKKRRGNEIHFVVPRLPGQTEVVPLSLDRLQQILSPD
jgi:3-dehydroquinate synthetase